MCGCLYNPERLFFIFFLINSRHQGTRCLVFYSDFAYLRAAVAIVRCRERRRRRRQKVTKLFFLFWTRLYTQHTHPSLPLPSGDHYLPTTLIPLWGGGLPQRKGGGKKGGLKTVLDESREKNTSTRTKEAGSFIIGLKHVRVHVLLFYVPTAGPKSKVCFIIRYRAGTTTIVPFLHLPPPPKGLLLIFFCVAQRPRTACNNDRKTGVYLSPSENIPASPGTYVDPKR